MIQQPLLGRIKTLLQSSSLRWNFVGNVTGRLWLGVMSLVTVPVFVHLLGTNAFGIVSLVATFTSFLALLDCGLACTANREVASLRGPENRGHIADVVRTFELIYWTVALVIGLGFAGLSSWIANSWVTKQSLSPADIRMAIILGGIALAARWPVALYTGVLQGLERQVLQNGILVVAATTRIGLTILALLFVSRTVYCFLVTQALANVMEVLLSGYVARRLANAGAQGRFSLAVVRRVWRFAISFNLVGAFGSLTGGTAGLLMGKLLPLVELTYYSVASTATGVLQAVCLPAHIALFPRLAAHWGQQNLEEMRRLYLLTLRFTIYLCAGPATVLCFFPSEVVALWTRSPELTQHVRLILPILTAANVVYCASNLSYTFLVATGKTRVPLLVNAISLPVMVMGCYVGIRAFGTSGAALCWLIWQMLCFMVYATFCFKKIFCMRPQPLLWGLPVGFLAVAVTTGIMSKAAMPFHLGRTVLTVWLLSTVMLCYVVNILLLKSDERNMLVAQLRRLRSLFQHEFRRTAIA